MSCVHEFFFFCKNNTTLSSTRKRTVGNRNVFQGSAAKNVIRQRGVTIQAREDLLGVKETPPTLLYEYTSAPERENKTKNSPLLRRTERPKRP
jgi:hypothetical protein